MGRTEVEVGDVFQWSHDSRPVRVLLYDAGIVMYDGWWPQLDDWGPADLQMVRR